jgi:hypothetical protein
MAPRSLDIARNATRVGRPIWPIPTLSEKLARRGRNG